MPFITFPCRNQDVFSICRIHTRCDKKFHPTNMGEEREMLISISKTCIMFRGLARMNLEKTNFLLQHCLVHPAHSHFTWLCIALQNFLSRPPASYRYLLLCCLEFLVTICLAFSHFPLLDHLQESLECSNK